MVIYREVDYLKKGYSERKSIIIERLEYFKKVGFENDERLFAELCFCLLTPQSKAKICDKAIQNLVNTNILFNGNEQDIKDYLIGVRFNNNKSKYILEARKLFSNEEGIIKIKEKLNEFKNFYDLREWLVQNVKGIGMKESVHFLRNIGYYDSMAMLDRHILKNLVKHNVIDKVPENLSKTLYLDIEEKMKNFSNDIGISMEELDLLFWSEETGEVFK
ncbi:N-glycosylase/DNA lyase [Candidatus Woesearchaeota archaeon]|nr:N-glycosylase/DNA lyase [Candidatus Woesearchaeota archaeon]